MACALRVAATLDLSNVEKVNGAALHQGASACVLALNEAGGVNGAPVELVVADDRFDPAATRRNALAFQADGSILALLHPQGTRQTGALMETVHDMAVVGPNTGAVALRRRDAANANRCSPRSLACRWIWAACASTSRTADAKAAASSISPSSASTGAC